MTQASSDETTDVRMDNGQTIFLCVCVVCWPLPEQTIKIDFLCRPFYDKHINLFSVFVVIVVVVVQLVVADDFAAPSPSPPLQLYMYIYAH